jgi:hypothetical protein
VTPPDVPFSAEVARYLADCAEHASMLRPSDHPTEDGAVKLIWHRTTDQAEQIRAAFRAAVARLAPAGPPQPRRAPDQEALTQAGASEA